MDPKMCKKMRKKPGKTTDMFFPPREMSRTVLRHEKKVGSMNTPLSAADALRFADGKSVELPAFRWKRRSDG
jgi:hypothetical protein